MTATSRRGTANHQCTASAIPYVSLWRSSTGCIAHPPVLQNKPSCWRGRSADVHPFIRNVVQGCGCSAERPQISSPELLSSCNPPTPHPRPTSEKKKQGRFCSSLSIHSAVSSSYIYIFIYIYIYIYIHTHTHTHIWQHDASCLVLFVLFYFFVRWLLVFFRFPFYIWFPCEQSPVCQRT